MTTTRTQVIIVGAGPSGLMLSHILQCEGIDSIVLERSSRDYVLQRIRAGVLEDGTVQMLRQHGLGQRLDAEGSVHNGTGIVWAGHQQFFIDVKKHTGRTMMAYGQTAITEDLYAARDAAGGVIIEQAVDVELHDVDTPEDWSDDRFWTELTTRMGPRLRPRSRPGHRSRSPSRRCAVSLPSRCAGDVCSWSVMPRISCPLPAPRV